MSIPEQRRGNIGRCQTLRERDLCTATFSDRIIVTMMSEISYDMLHILAIRKANCIIDARAVSAHAETFVALAPKQRGNSFCAIAASVRDLTKQVSEWLKREFSYFEIQVILC